MKREFTQLVTMAEILKAIAHPVRLCIASQLAENGECNVSYMQNCLQKPQSTISQHLQKLKSAGVISPRRQGVEVYYSIADKRIKKYSSPFGLNIDFPDC